MTDPSFKVVHQYQTVIQRWTGPTQRNTDMNSFLSDFGKVTQRVTNGHITVNRYEHHGSYWGGCKEKRGIVKQSTYKASPKPAATYKKDMNRH